MSVEINELRGSVRRVIEAAGVAASGEKVWAQAVELGWLMVDVPEALGGLGMGIQAASVIHTELGRGLVSAPYLSNMLVLDALCHSSVESQKEWIERVFAGQAIAASLSDCDIKLHDSQLSGNIVAVPNVKDTSHILLWTASKELVLLVALDQPGIEVVSTPVWDQTRPLYEVKIKQIDLVNQTILAEGSSAYELINRLLLDRDFALAAESIGSAAAILDLTVDHLQTRVQFKRPLAMFQALKHRCADMKADISAAEAMLNDATLKVSDGLETKQARLNSMAAKMLATTTFAQVAEDCLQLHGGIGMADEHPCHLYLKRSLLNEQLGGRARDYAVEIACGHSPELAL